MNEFFSLQRDCLQEEKIGPLDLPELVSGAATWSHFYNEEDKLSTDVPLRTIRLALRYVYSPMQANPLDHTHRYGIRAFDTAPFYDNSEIVLGTALKALSLEFPRGTYQLLTKVGRYGADDFDYTPATVRRSVQRSLQRLQTQYLDVVYLHDIEFVAPCVAPRVQGNHASALGVDAAAYGLASEQQQEHNDTTSGRAGGGGEDRDTSSSQVRDEEGDERVLAAISELRALQADGLIRHVGISGPFRSVPLPPSLFQ